jgi:hypothetical protein
MKRRIAISAFLVTTAVALAEDFDTWREASPDKALFAIERRMPDPSAPSRLDLDGFAVFICTAESGSGSLVTPGAVIAQHEFSGRVVSQIRWSPDSKFLLFTTASSGGHSPWHFKTFLFCAGDKSFRDVETAAGGSVGAAEFSFEASDVAILRLYQPADGSPKQVKLPLSKAVHQMQRLE